MKLSGRWVFTDEPIVIEVVEGRVKTVTRPAVVASTDAYLAPGFIDAQVNGYRGADYSLDDLSIEHVRSIVNDITASGATRHVATVVTSPQERILRNLEVVAHAVRNDPDLALAIPGIHLEGPYISSEDGPRGAHDRSFVRDPDVGELAEWIAASEGLLCVVTLAPERDGSVDFIEALNEAGIVASIGHTGATGPQIRAAVDAGAKLSTHLGNGSHAMLPRLKNYLWEQLAADELHMGMICDGFHLPAPVVKTFLRAKGPARTILVSDVALYGGTAPGRYKWGNIDIEVHDYGHLGVADTPYLAGAGHTLSWDIPRFIEYTGSSLADAVRLCTVNPAALFGFDCVEKPPSVGDTADLIEFTYRAGDRRLEIGAVVRGAFSRRR